MKHFVKTNAKRIAAAILCVVMCLAALPFSAFAFTAEVGKTVNAYYGAKYIGSDGEKYHSPATYQYITYDSGGNVSLHSKKAGGARSKLMIKDSSGARQVLCIESGVDYNAKGTYTSESGKNNAYFQNLPAAVQYGLMLTSVYGWHPGKTAPVSGTNEDDFAIATQSILWEYQQQLRTSPTTLSANSYGIPADTYYNGIQGRPAEKCYDWLLSQMQSHATVPSFASHRSGSAEVYTLKYNQAADNYSLTLTDTNNTLADIKFSASGITVSRSGNQYTFTSKKMLESAVGITAQKSIPNIDGNILIWGYPGKQTMMSGAEDPVVFYLKVKTETTGIGHIVKHSEDSKVDGVKFNIAGNGVNQTVTTKRDGTVDIELMPGVYTVTELAEEKYEPQSVQRVTIVSGHTSTVTFSNVLKRGGLKVIKSSEDNFVEGVAFHLYGTSLSGIAVDEYAVTDANGVATFEGVLISGTEPYTVEEVDTAVRYVIPEKQNAPIKWNEVTTYAIENKAGVGFVNAAMKGSLKIIKTSSDGKVEGFSFRVTGANGYDEIFKTDENGEIFIEGLRIGEYTVSEVADSLSAAYNRPADKTATVMTDSTTIVEMHNVFMDNPKTGDNSKLGLWFALLGLSVAGIGVTAYTAIKNRKKEDAE